MKRILLAAAAFAVSATVALADNLAGYYGNTVEVTAPDGKVSKSRVNADKTWSTVNPDGSTSKGTWAWKDEKTACFTQTEPPPAPDAKPACFEIQPHKPGDSWEVKSPDGKMTTKFRLIAG
jgi:hypothetical protein